MSLTNEQRSIAVDKSRMARARRKEELASCRATYDQLLRRFPAHQAKVEALKAGSMKAAIALKCLDCCNGQMNEVRHCSVEGCPVWPLRPWKEHRNDEC